MIIDNECLIITKQMPYPAMTHGRHKRFTFTVQNVDHTNFFNELQFMLLTAGTLQNRKCTFVNVIERFAVYNTVAGTHYIDNKSIRDKKEVFVRKSTTSVRHVDTSSSGGSRDGERL